MEKAQQLYKVAIQRFESDDWKEAIRVGRQVTKLQPRSARPYSVIARSYQELGRWKMAERFYRQSLLSSKHPGTGCYSVGYLIVRDGTGAGDYFLHKNGLGQPDLYENVTPVTRNGYLTDLLTERAVNYVKRRRRGPFFLSLHYTAPHWPWQGLERLTSEFEKWNEQMLPRRT